jgi:hypothetical protein
MPTWRSPTFLTTPERTGIRADLSALLDESTVGVASISYVRRNLDADADGSAAYAPSTGVVTDSTSKQTISALVGVPTDQDASDMGVVLEVTMRKFLIDYSDLSAAPTSGDLIVYDGTTFEVVSVNHHKASNVVMLLGSVMGGEA